MLYAVIDTNVLVSAALALRSGKSSPPWQVLRLIFMGAVIPVFNNEILQEYEDVLNRRKFRFKSDVVKILISQIETLGISQDALKVNNDFPDQDDAVFFKVAMGVKQNHENSFLVTGNIKHFPKDPIVVTPAQFICIIEMLSGEHHPSV